MSQKFVYFSNTAEEFEAFINANKFYWPRAIAKKTEYQRKINNLHFEEEEGDIVYIVTGHRLKSQIQDLYLKQKINNSPMITYKGKIKKVIDRPVIGYRYTHNTNPDSSFMLPLEFYNEFKQFETYLGKAFTQSNRNEIKQVLQLKEIVNKLLHENKIFFERAHYKDDEIFIKNSKKDNWTKLNNNLDEYTNEELNVSNHVTYREMPSIDSLLLIADECNTYGLDGDQLIQNIRTWRGTSFVEVELIGVIFETVNASLNQGISTRLISEGDASNNLMNEIQKTLDSLIQSDLESTIQSDIYAEDVENGKGLNDLIKEGRAGYYYGKKYERNPINRKRAIEIHGLVCKACDFDFEKFYGEHGKNFIEIHHIKPLSTLDEEMVIDPEYDLVPLCSNCHRMVHRKKENVLSVEELRNIISNNQSS